MATLFSYCEGSKHNNKYVILLYVWALFHSYLLCSVELLAEDVLRLRVFLLWLRRARLRAFTSPPSQLEQQYGAASTRTSSPPSISHGRAARTCGQARQSLMRRESNRNRQTVINQLKPRPKMRNLIKTS